MSRVSVVIPARNEPYLAKTVDDLFRTAWSDLEVVVVLDGCEAPDLKERDRLVIVRHETAKGARVAINNGVNVATGRYVLKLDAHCRLSEGFDEILKRDHEYEWLVTVPRYIFRPETWTTRHFPIEYERVDWPFHPGRAIGGLVPRKWYGESGMEKDNQRPECYYYLEFKRKHLAIDEIQTCNGAFFFIEKKRYLEFGGLDERFWNYQSDICEIAFKAWLSGGAFMINKRAWHGHWWKSEDKRGWKLDWRALRRSAAYLTWYWSHDQWPGAKRPFKWFVEHFWPIPGWPDNWEEVVSNFKEPELGEFPA